MIYIYWTKQDVFLGLSLPLDHTVSVKIDRKKQEDKILNLLDTMASFNNKLTANLNKIEMNEHIPVDEFSIRVLKDKSKLTVSLAESRILHI